MVGISLFVLWLSLVSTTTTTSAFRTTTNNRVRRISSSTSIAIINNHRHQQQSHYHIISEDFYRQQQQRQRQQPPRGLPSLLFSSTALTSPLQPVPEESSVIENSINNNNDGDDMDNMKMTTNIGIGGNTKIQNTKQQQKLDYIRTEGGRFSFNTKYGALNPFAIYYGVTSILLGLPWFIALTCYQFLQFITLGRFDRLRRIPVHLNQLWGESLLVLTRCFPEMIHRDILQNFYKEYVLFLLFSLGSVVAFLMISMEFPLHLFLLFYQRTTSYVCCQSQLMDGHTILGCSHWMEEL